MTLSEYAKTKKMNYEQYQTLTQNINEIADAILINIKQLHKTDTGIYYPITEILNYNYNGDDNVIYFIISALKKIGVEFYDNNTMYRY